MNTFINKFIWPSCPNRGKELPRHNQASWPYMVVANGLSARRQSLAAAAKTASSWVENGAVNVGIVSVSPK